MVRAVLITCAVVLFTGLAHADKDRARAAYRRGMQHYNLTEYREALDAFKEAYREYEEPSLLFNIGQCHRQLGDRPLAIRFFKNYLNGVPNAPNREDVQTLIATLEREMEQASKAGPPQGTLAPPESRERRPEPLTQPVPTPAPVVTAAPSAKSDAPRRTRPWVWAVVGIAAAVAVGAGVGLGVGLGIQPNDPVPSLGSVTKE